MQNNDGILVVDDSSIMRQTVKNALVAAGYTNVVVASNGVDAMEKCRAQTFKVIFLDWNMPEMDGISFLKAYRNDWSAQKTAIIMVTAVSNKADVLTALENGVTDYITKPVSPDTIVKKMKMVKEWLAEQEETHDTFFTPHVMDLLKREVSQRLVETFGITFGLGLTEENSGNTALNDPFKAYVELTGKSMKAFLNVAIQSAVIDEMDKIFDLKASLQEAEIGQDVTREIAHVMGHAIQNYFSGLPGRSLKAGLPLSGNAQPTFSDIGVLNLQFQSKTGGAVSLNFIYPISAELELEA